YLIFIFNSLSPSLFYTLSLHDALPISLTKLYYNIVPFPGDHQIHNIHLVGKTIAKMAALLGITEDAEEEVYFSRAVEGIANTPRSEEHTSELQSPYDLVCRLLLEKKKK